MSDIYSRKTDTPVGTDQIGFARSSGNRIFPLRTSVSGLLSGITLTGAQSFSGGVTFTDGITGTFTSASTDGGTSVEPIAVTSTMTGAGGVGGRARFKLAADGALGGWANALKGHTVFGASGSVTGLGSAVLAELELSAGTASGSYAPLEIELGLATDALTGSRTSFMSLNVYGDDKSTFDDNGYLFDVGGVTAGAAKMFRTGLSQAVTASANLRINVAGTNYFIPLCAVSALTS
jgi:hypothetical protein